jgi:hypothetical protein
VYFQDAVFRDYFDDEAKISIIVALTTGEEKYLKEKEDENNGSATSGSN